MMLTVQRFLIVLLASIVCACSMQRADVARPYTPLILISLDGFRADYLTRGLTPNLQALADDGVLATFLRPSFPTLTFPNHYTIVTGLYPDHHGIVNNRFVDPLTKKEFVYKDQATIANPAWWGGEPIWVGVEKQGKHAATMFWPGSDVAIAGVRPELWSAFNGKVPLDARVATVLSWLDLPRDRRPDFATLYLESLDHAGHDHGPDSDEVNQALTNMDAVIGRLIEGLKQRQMFDSSNIVIVSDHGMTAAGEDRIVILDDVVDIGSIDVINAGVLAAIVAKPGQQREVEASLLHPLDHMRCWRKSEIPARLHYGTNARIPPYVCVADDGWVIDTRDYLNGPKRHISHGEHGYDNDDPNMRALFIAHGPAFKRGLTVPPFDNVDIYPMLTKILGINAQPNDGKLSDVEAMLVNP